jgi:hypothetical protein
LQPRPPSLAASGHSSAPEHWLPRNLYFHIACAAACGWGRCVVVCCIEQLALPRLRAKPALSRKVVP